MSFDPANPTPADLALVTAGFSNPLTLKITDYLKGNQLGPERSLAILSGDTSQLPEPDSDISYWSGDLLPSSDPRYTNQVKTIRRSFTFRNVLREGVEMLADGVGADEPDWGLVPDRNLDDGEQPTEQETERLAEAESILTNWWDKRNLPSLILETAVNAIAHGRQPLRPRLPARFRDAQGRLIKRLPEKSLDGLWFVAPSLADSGIYVDPDTMEEHGITRVWVAGDLLKSAWEISHVDEKGLTNIRTINSTGEVSSPVALDLGGALWLLELNFPRGVVSRDALSQQDARNVASTALNRNTRHAVFEKTILLGVDPPLGADGKPQPLSGPGAESYLQPAVQTEIEQTGLLDAAGQPVTVTREKFFSQASITKLDPAEPKAIQAAIDQATEDLYGILRQLFMLMSTDGRASGRSREVATGSYLRATARYATAVESFIRDLLMMALKVSAIVQGDPKRYDGIKPVVTCRQKVFEPSPETVRMALDLYKDGVISLQTLRTIAGVADPDAEEAQIVREAEAKAKNPDKPDPSKDPDSGDGKTDPEDNP